MPDYSMCAHPTCPARTTCRRHNASGSTPDDAWQSYGVFTPIGIGGCAYFMPLDTKRSDIYTELCRMFSPSQNTDTNRRKSGKRSHSNTTAKRT